MKKRDGDGTNWGAGGCRLQLGAALWLTLVAMLANLSVLVRYIRTGVDLDD